MAECGANNVVNARELANPFCGHWLFRNNNHWPKQCWLAHAYFRFI